MSNEVLMQRIASRDQQALEVLYHRYYRRLYWFICRITGHFGSAGVLVNDVMYVIWDTAAQARPATRLSVWIFGIACDRALKALAHQGGLQYRQSRGAVDDEERTFDPRVWHQRLRSENSLLTAMAQLSPRHRTIVELTCHYGLSCREVAEVMHCSESSVKTQMLEARKTLRTVLPTRVNHHVREEG